MTPDADADATSPAEERLLEHLRALREYAPEPDDALAAKVIRTARWQATIRPFALAAAGLIAGMGDSARVIVRAAGA